MEHLPAKPPATRLLLAEALELPRLLVNTLLPTVPLAPGHGAPVMVIPGFMARDYLTSRLRRSLEVAGYEAEGWGLGLNQGVRADLFERLGPRVARLAERTGQPVTLIGWSLGGIFAREMAKHSPSAVRMVITLGSPFSADPRSNNAWRLYQLVAAHPVDAPPIEAVLAEKPPMPTVALWSRRDGVVSIEAARGEPGERDEDCEVDCRHLGFTADPEAIRAIGAALDRSRPIVG